jgi:cellulase/cellobiase CelA1
LQYPDQAFKQLNVGGNFTFKAGYKLFNNSYIQTQSFQSPATIPRVILTDTTGIAQVANFTNQPNASEPFVKFTLPAMQRDLGAIDYKVG